MDAPTREALKQSIKKWEQIVKGDAQEHGADDCALCQMFIYTYRCGECPVAQLTGHPACFGSPYRDWYTYGDSLGDKYDMYVPLYALNELKPILAEAEYKKLKGYAKAELKLLKGLRDGVQ